MLLLESQFLPMHRLWRLMTQIGSMYIHKDVTVWYKPNHLVMILHSPTFSFHGDGSLFSNFESSDIAKGILLTYVNTEEAVVTTGRGLFMPPQYSPLCEEYFFEKSFLGDSEKMLRTSDELQRQHSEKSSHTPQEGIGWKKLRLTVKKWLKI